MKKKVISFIDGFNLYFGLKKYGNKYKWLDLWNLSQRYLNRNEKLEGVFYFTALPYWNYQKMLRHKAYIQAVQQKKVKVVYGNFRRVEKTCRAVCKEKYKTYEEKETDSNIVLYMTKLAYENQYDKALLVSSDSDFVSVIKTIKAKFLNKEVQVIIPVNLQSFALKKETEFTRMKEKHLSECQISYIENPYYNN